MKVRYYEDTSKKIFEIGEKKYKNIVFERHFELLGHFANF
jgi:hypothetical protein